MTATIYFYERHWCPTCSGLFDAQEDGTCENCNGRLGQVVLLYECPRCERAYPSKDGAGKCDLCEEER